jgi:hypothetical protein
VKRSSLASLLALSALAPAVARGDGAFPDSFALFAPADQPSRLVLATNFGLLRSEDDGATWFLVCEQAMNAYNAFLYGQSVPPLDALGAASPSGLALSSDGACTWTTATGGVSDGFVEDFFFDPSQPSRTLAVLSRPNGPDGGQQPMAVYENLDGGDVFDTTPWYSSTIGIGIQSLEVSRSNPQTVYLTRYQFQLLPDGGQLAKPFLDRTDDDGQTWNTFDLSPQLGTLPARIAAVDPVDATKVYLRVVDAFTGHDALAVATDGGAALDIPLHLNATMTGFLRRANGEILVTTKDSGSQRSIDQGQSFQPWATDLHLRAVAERGQTLYLVADNFLDGFAVASSSDDGTSRTPLLVFNKNLCGPATCGNLTTTCATPWAALKSTLVIPDDVCTPKPPGSCHCGQGEGALAAWAALASVAWRRRRPRR